jgi:predicted histone-like DNA-binding protein
MSIFLKPVQRRNPADEDAPMKWYPVQYTTKLVDETEVAELIADETTLNPMEAQMAIRQLRKVVQRLLLDGKSVKLGNWGTFNVTLNTEGADTKDALTARNVKMVNINFQPGTELKAAMQRADFVWLNKITADNNSGGDSDSPDIINNGEDDRPVIE